MASLHTVERAGAPPLIVLVHGSMDRASSFSKVMSALAAAGRNVVAYDRRGYAHSRNSGPPPASLDEQSDDLLSVMAGRRSVIAGHSLGADVAMLTAVRRPDLVAALVVWEPPMPWMDWWPTDGSGGFAVGNGVMDSDDPVDPADAAEGFIRRVVGDDRWEKLPPSTKEARRAEGATLVAELRSVRGEPPFDPADIRVPTVIGCGTESRDHHRESTSRLVEIIPGAELHVVEGAQHGCHLSHPNEFAALVERALVLGTEVAT